MKINGYWVATETEATDANGAHVSLRDWRHQESGMTLKVKRKKKLKKKKGKRRGAEDRKVGVRGSKLRGEKRRVGEKGEKGNKTYLKRKFLMIGSMNLDRKKLNQ